MLITNATCINNLYSELPFTNLPLSISYYKYSSELIASVTQCNTNHALQFYARIMNVNSEELLDDAIVYFVTK